MVNNSVSPQSVAQPNDEGLTDRQKREREFYATHSASLGQSDVNLAPVNGSEPPRPWNPYWYTLGRLPELYQNGARRLVDFGCGAGDMGISAAYVGFSVLGFDITPENIEQAEARAERAGVADRTTFTVGTAENISIADNSFDVIVGVDILHHVDIQQAMDTCLRVLKPGGTMLFQEPVVAPLFDTFRNTWLMRRLFPNTPSFDMHITQDERKLDRHDLDAIRARFPNVVFTPFRFLSRVDKLFSQSSRWEKYDMALLRRFSALRPMAGYIVMEGTKSDR